MQVLRRCEASFAFDITISGAPLFRTEQIESRLQTLSSRRRLNFNNEP
jgi:hypothetical protein